jgi:hypothetical protein
MFGHNKDDDTNEEPVADSTLGINNSTAADFSSSDDTGLSLPSTAPATEPDADEELLPAHASGSSADDEFKPSDDAPAQDSSTDSTGDLLDIKQKALTQLSPLVSHLDQSPEERFKTIMMMIQAADNQALIPDAYEAAQTIPDEKAKAQALLDVVNEINYFTQQSKT